MLSYQHIYHAGNHADVHKHSALYALLTHMLEKGKPLSYMETHAGRGRYPLTATEMQKTGEFKRGAGQLLQHPDPWADTPLASWLQWLSGHFRHDQYPGSPLLAAELLPAPHQLQLMELHPAEFSALKQNLKGRNIHLHQRDGREGMVALSPPQPRRGVLLIDPSWEEKNDYRYIPARLQDVLRRWPNAVVMIWYPLLASAAHRVLEREIPSLAAPCLQQEWAWTRPPEGHGMYGSGLLLLNPPWGLDTRWQALLDTLCRWQAPTHHQQRWLIEAK